MSQDNMVCENEVVEQDAGGDSGTDGVNKSNFLDRPDALSLLIKQYSRHNLPKTLLRKVNALKNLQLKEVNIEKEFFKEIHLLECKYNEMYTPLREQRMRIVTGAYEPIDEECEWDYASIENSDEVLSKELAEKIILYERKGEDDTTPDSSVDVKRGIPYFWLTVLKSVPMIAEMIQEHDEPILAHLVDMKVILSPNPMSFKLEFHFSPNEFFTNSILTKLYEMKCDPEEEEPLCFEGPEIIKSTGCTINWKPGKNVTITTIKKKQKHRTKNTATRTVTKTVRKDSFFNFFSPPHIPEDTSEIDENEELDALLTNDYEIGHYMRERLIPKAVVYFTGEAVSDDEDYDEDEEGVDEGVEETDEEEESSIGDDEQNRRNTQAATQREQECKHQ